MQNNKQAVFDWETENGIELNVKKTTAMIFGSVQNLAILPDDLLQITIHGSPIPYIQQAKNLDLLMTQTLNWQPRITTKKSIRHA